MILIIGIIVAGVTQASRLVREFRLSSAQNLTKSSPVSGIGGLSLWFDAVSDKVLTNTIFDRVLLTEERKAVEQYLGKKWNVKIS